nr:bahd acyltransferase dcr [Quercus suber]
MEPSLSNDYFGNSLYAVGGVTTAVELLEHNLGWAAWKLHEFFDPYSVRMVSSPRFNVYENEFGMGIAMALPCGNTNKFDGKVSSYLGREGGGSIDLDLCLLSESMSALESDEEFMDSVSLSH